LGSKTYIDNGGDPRRLWRLLVKQCANDRELWSRGCTLLWLLGILARRSNHSIGNHLIIKDKIKGGKKKKKKRIRMREMLA
jgi:hypothetical protein